VFALIYGTILVAAFLNAAHHAPDLPRITINVDSAQSESGRLLDHTDGYWYMFDSRHRLLAIPDDDAGTVEIFD
jgi:hypothetical protein